MVRNLFSLRRNRSSLLRKGLRTNRGDALPAARQKRRKIKVLADITTTAKNAKCFLPPALRAEKKLQCHSDRPEINRCIVGNASTPRHATIGKLFLQKPTQSGIDWVGFWLPISLLAEGLDAGHLNRLRCSPYPSFSSSSLGINRSAAELIQ